MRIRMPAGKRKKSCSKCGNEIEKSRHGKQRYCKSCHAEYMRLHRPKHRDLPDHRRVKANARSYANVYIKRGTLKKMPCEKCGEPKSQMHHDDYSKPLDVRWFCRPHHMELHGHPQNA